MAVKKSSKLKRVEDATAALKAISSKKAGGPPLPPVQDSDFYKGLHFGLPRSGKTQLAATAAFVPELTPTLFLDCGTSSQTFVSEPGYEQLAANAYYIRTVDQLNETYMWLANGAVSDYNCLILDELDSLYEIVMGDRMEEVIADKPDRDPDKPSLEDYGIVRNRMIKIVNAFLDLPIHIIITSWANKSKNVDTGREEYAPSLPGKLSNDIAGKTPVIAYQEFARPRRLKKADELEGYVIHFQPTDAFTVGVRGDSRAQRLGPALVNTNMAEIFRLWSGA